MWKTKLIFSFLAIIAAVAGQAQNQLKVIPLAHRFVTSYGVEAFVKVKVTCEGNQPNTPVSLNLSQCQSDSSLQSITFSNGTSLTPGNSTIITFKFKFSSPGSLQTVINYKYALGYGCGSSASVMIDIKGVYNHECCYGTCNSGNVKQPTDFFASEITPYCVTYNWSPVSGASYYKVEYSNPASWQNTSTTTSQQLQTSANSIVLCGLTPGETYAVSVQAYKDDQNCNSSRSIAQWIKIPCNDVLPPTGITATPYSYGYKINYFPQNSCLMEYVNLATGSTGATTINPASGEFFYYVSQTQSFKFRLKFSGGCATWSDWVTVDANQCSTGNYPTNLMVYSQCGSSNLPSVCGGIVKWTRPANTANYQIEYIIYNVAGQTYTGTFGSSYNSQTLSYYPPSSMPGPWMIKVRAKAQCSNGTWSDYSPWTNPQAW